MKRILFCKVMNVVSNHDYYFVQRKDVCGGMGLSMIQKCTATLRMLAHNVAIDAIDDYYCLVETIATKCLKCFVRPICAIF
jgi:hypothetical protein